MFCTFHAVHYDKLLKKEPRNALVEKEKNITSVYVVFLLFFFYIY
jgi:hypothetical protein